MRIRRTNYTDEEILQMIKAGGKPEDRAYEYVYKTMCLTTIASMLKGDGIQSTDIDDIIQLTMMAFCRAVRENQFKGNSMLSTFLYSIANFRKLDFLRKKGTSKVELKDNMLTYDRPDEHIIQIIEDEMKEERDQLFTKLLALLSEEELQILNLRGEKMPDQEIAERMNMEVATIRQKVWRIKKKWKKYLDENPGLRP